MWEKLKIAFNRFLRKRWIQHLGFWSLSFLILLNILKVTAEVKGIDFIYTAAFHVPLMLVVYLNLQLLFPCFLEKERYLLYSLFSVLTVVLGAGFYLVLFDRWIDFFFEGYYFIAFYSFWDISLYFVIYLATTSLLRLARGWFQLKEIEAEKNKAELKALQSQINPHFLFNSLNSIYSLSRKKSDEVPRKIVQLSDLLRHVIYDSEHDFIPLEKEISMIRNYVELQNLRSVEEQRIKIEVTGEPEGKWIAPMLILPFIENSFKHGIKGGQPDAFVRIQFTVAGTLLTLLIQNSKGKAKRAEVSEKHGIGIENVRKRLELIYPKTHVLRVDNGEKEFSVHLQIHLNDDMRM